MNLIGAVIGGAIGALIGGAIWVAVGYATHYEIGWIAWGVGAAAGLGAAAGSRGEGGPVAGVIAVVFAISSILLAKYVVVQMLVDNYIKTHPVNVQNDIPNTDADAYWTGVVADQLIEERETKGQPVKWPAGVDPESAEFEADYPKDIWTDASKRFKAMTPQARTEYRDQHVAMLEQFTKQFIEADKSSMYQEGFMASFGLFDIIFGLLAIGSAFKLGSGGAASTEA